MNAQENSFSVAGKAKRKQTKEKIPRKMSTTIEKLVRKNIEQAMEKEYLQFMKNEQGLLADKQVEPDSPQLHQVINKFKGKMAVVTQAEVVFSGQEGEDITLQWEVRNDTKSAWP